MKQLKVFVCLNLKGDRVKVFAVDTIDAKEVCLEQHGFWPSDVEGGNHE